MPDTVELCIEKVLNGQALDGQGVDLCDYTLEDQNAALESQGIKPATDSNYKPILGDTVTYIVAVVIINENNEVLMMQEAKKSCAGKWYLPAGRMEKGETIIEAGKREVLEETGLNVDLTTLLMVECASGCWIRFVLTGKVTGGILKTPAQADKESLQAKWIRDLDELTLRAQDITILIERARAYVAARKIQDKTWHSDLLPALRSHSKVMLRLIVLIKKKATNCVHVLISERNSWHLPTCECHPSKSVHSTLRRFMVDIFGAEVAAHRLHGILSIEHDPRNSNDGVCFTLLVAFKVPLEDVPIIGKCVWHETSKELSEKLLNKVSSKNSTFPLHVIR